MHAGFVYPNQFLSALSAAGINKEMKSDELQLICDVFTVPRSPTLIMVDYKSFIDEVETVFSLPGLESFPLAAVQPEPDFLDRTRFRFSSRVLPDDVEAVVQATVDRLREQVGKRRTPVQAFFDDAAREVQKTKGLRVVGHVSRFQFRQVMATMDLIISEDEAKAIIEKFHHEKKPE